MSLKNFVGMPDVKARIKGLRPRFRRTFDVPLRASPRSERHSLLGTAFDYLLRFDLQRRAPHAVGRVWAAEQALDLLSLLANSYTDGDPTKRVPLADNATFISNFPPDEVLKGAQEMVGSARAAVAAYLKEKSPSRERQAEMAACAIRLAKLDAVIRARWFEPGFMDVASEDVEDLLAMLDIVPFEKLVHPQIMLLNPTFGEASRLIGGADADLIAGDMLVDFKATKKKEMDAGDLDKMIGYFLLARRCPDMPAINRIGLYYARHAHLLQLNTSDWLSHPEFAEIQTWFLQRAGQVYGTTQKTGA